jgi:hypothetical protein
VATRPLGERGRKVIEGGQGGEVGGWVSEWVEREREFILKTNSGGSFYYLRGYQKARSCAVMDVGNYYVHRKLAFRMSAVRLFIITQRYTIHINVGNYHLHIIIKCRKLLCII